MVDEIRKLLNIEERTRLRLPAGFGGTAEKFFYWNWATERLERQIDDGTWETLGWHRALPDENLTTLHERLQCNSAYGHPILHALAELGVIPE